MFLRYGVVAAAATLLTAGVGNAQSLAPIQSRSITLGPIYGGVYYDVVPEGDRVVGTLQCSSPRCIVRFIATLAPGQSVTLSTRRGVGEAPIMVQIERHDNQLFVQDGSPGVERSASVVFDHRVARGIAHAP